MDQVLSYIEKNRQRNLDRLFECLRMESISADSSKVDEIRRCGQWCAKLLEEIGFDDVGVKETGGLPAVYGQWLKAGADKPTIMVYGHYDVQPADPVEKWDTPPFEPTIREGYIYGRGTSDDKAQFLTHLFALEALMKVGGGLPVNVKVFLESEEEKGTGGTERFVEENAHLLASDAVVLSDTSWPSADMPTIIYALRGIAYFQVNVKGPNRDLHSGMYGGKVQNTLNGMAKIIAALHDKGGRIAIPGIYDDVLRLTKKERKEFAKVAENDRTLKQDLGVKALGAEKGFTVTESNWARPSLDVNGIWGGYMGEGAKTVIPSEGGFKISMRLVPNQKAKKVHRQLADYVKRVCPPGLKADVSMLHMGEPVMVPTDSPYITCAQTAIKKAFGKRPLLVREGASVPITATFLKALKAPPIMMGFGLHEDNIHAPNERFKVDHFYKGIVAAAHFLNEAARAKAR
jgi:acetylornithine deacetylase/succinyl-diaminopimelate desuccinylase-like protein